MKTSSTLAFFIIISNVVFAQAYIETANSCYEKKDYQCAIDNYLIALDKKTYKEEQRYLLESRIGKGYFRLKQYEKAIEYLQKAITSKPDDLYSYWTLADTYYNINKYENALANYKKASGFAIAAKDKENIIWWTGNCYIELEKQSLAIAEFKKVQSREGDFYKTDAFIGDAFFNLKQYDSAMAYYKKAESYFKTTDSSYKDLKCFLGKCYRELFYYEKAMEQQDAALTLYPKYAEAIWEKGILYANKKDFSTAIDWYKKALPSFANDSAASYTLCGNIAACYQRINNYTEAVNWQLKRKTYSKNRYTEYSIIATLQYGQLKQYAAAEKTCIEAINLYVLEPEYAKKTNNGSYVKLNAIVGKIALEKKDTTKAQKYFEEALRVNKNAFEPNAGAGEIAWARKKEADYKKYYNNIYKSLYDTLISSKKEIANVYGRSAFIDANINKYQSSSYSSSVEKALSLDSLQKEAVLLWPIVLSNGYGYNLTNKRGACLSIINKAIKQYATDKEYVSDLYNSKAVILEKDDTLAIRKALEEAVKIYPENMRPWDNLLKYYSSYNNAVGVVMAEKLIAILKKKKDNATAATAYLHKGDFLWRLNKKEEAKKAYQEALIWDPNNSTAKERSKMQ